MNFHIIFDLLLNKVELNTIFYHIFLSLFALFSRRWCFCQPGHHFTALIVKIQRSHFLYKSGKIFTACSVLAFALSETVHQTWIKGAGGSTEVNQDEYVFTGADWSEPGPTSRKHWSLNIWIRLCFIIYILPPLLTSERMILCYSSLIIRIIALDSIICLY